MIYYTHTIAGPSVLAPSPPTYLETLTTAYMYMYVLFTLIQLWSVPEKSGCMTSTALLLNLRYIEVQYNKGPVYTTLQTPFMSHTDKWMHRKQQTYQYLAFHDVDS